MRQLALRIRSLDSFFIGRRSSSGSSIFLLFIVILPNHASKMKSSFVETRMVAMASIDHDCISVVIVQASICRAGTVGVICDDSDMNFLNHATEVSSWEMCPFVRAEKLDKASNIFSKLSHCFVVRIRGVAEEIGNVEVFTSEIGIVGVNIVEKESTSVSIAAKNGSSGIGWFLVIWLMWGRTDHYFFLI